MRLEVNRRGHRWCAIGADVECFWCGETFVSYNSAPFCTTAHRLLWNDQRRPRRPGMPTPEQQEEVMRVIRARLGLQEVEQQDERRSA
jgi:hypothetical protein